MSSFKVLDQPLPDLYVCSMPFYPDSRGDFIKTYNLNSFSKLGLDFIPAECFYTHSAKNVLRGMHYQINSAAHSKLVHCISGAILDVVVCINPSLPHFKCVWSSRLDSAHPVCIFIGKDYAHGFLSLDDHTLVNYMTSTVHDPCLDKGVHWNSIDYSWPIDFPITSQRDTLHPSISLVK